MNVNVNVSIYWGNIDNKYKSVHISQIYSLFRFPITPFTKVLL